MGRRINNVGQPPQRLPYKKKTKKWRKDNVEFADKHSFYHNESVRQTLRNKIVNLNLYNGIVDVQDMTLVVNPHSIEADFVPDNIPHHPIAVPKIDLLVGEQAKRRFDWSVIVTNPDAISKKEEDKKKLLQQKITEFLQANYQDEELETKMQGLQKYMKYEWQDVREKMANQILKHYWAEQEFSKMFTNGFKNALIMAEETYQVGIEHGEPFAKILNPLKVHAIRSGNSDKIEDSNIIIVEDHWSTGKIIDVYHDELKPADIDTIMEYTTTSGTGSYSDDHNNHTLLRDGAEELISSYLNIAELNGHTFSSDYTDTDGNMRVLQVFWKSLKKIKKVKYYDEAGEVQYKIRSEEYIEDKDKGEEVTSLWVNEWWEGTMIGKDIFLNMKPRSIQYNKVNNPSYCHPGIIGQIYNTNQGRAISLMDRMKNYQYLYDAVWDRLNKAIASNHGKILELDIAKIPENWEIDKWLHFAVVNKIAVMDSFKEGNHGAATGKLAGSMNTVGGRAIDLDTGNYIQQHQQLLEFIKHEMGEIAGVSAQRQGQISNRETVGGVERSVNQSSHITEYWFLQHESVKIRVLSAFLDTAKFALKGKNKKAQYILDDQSIALLEMDGDQFAECDYGLVVTNSTKTVELEQMLKQSAQAFMQNGGSMSVLMDIMFAPSLMDMRRKLETAEEEAHQRSQEAQQAQAKQAEAQMQAQMQAEQAKMQLEQAKLQLDEANNIRDNETRIRMKEMDLMNSGEEVDDTEAPLDREKFENDKSNFNQELELKKEKQRDDRKKQQDDVKLKEKALAVQKQNKQNSNS